MFFAYGKSDAPNGAMCAYGTLRINHLNFGDSRNITLALVKI